MAFAVQLYAMTKEVNSTKRPTGDGTVYQCVSNDDLDIIHPRLPLNIGTAANPAQYNFCYVPSFGRYYWITRWVLEGALWTAYCDIDPLASWKTGIGATSAYVLRAAAASDGLIVDDMYPAKAAPTVTQVTATKWWTDSALNFTNGHYVVGTISKGGATHYYALTPTEFDLFASTVFSNNFFDTEVKPEADYITRAIFDPMQYLSSVMWFPESLADTPTEDIYLGYWDSGVNGRPLGNTFTRAATFTIPKHPQAATRGAYLNMAPYSDYLVDLMPFGRINLDPSKLQGQTVVTCSVIIDRVTGVAVLRIYGGTTANGNLIYTGQAQYGVSVQLSQIMIDYMGAVSSVASGITSAIFGGPAGIVSGIASAIGNGAKAMTPDVTTSGVNAGFASLTGDWVLIGRFLNIVDEDNTHRGRPLCQVRRLDTLPGYQLCTDTDVELPATRAELDMIKSYLESGYYYE